MNGMVYVNSSGDKVWSPNTKEDLCAAVMSLSHQLAQARIDQSVLMAELARVRSGSSDEEEQR